MNEPKYFTPYVRCYSDGRVERTNPRCKIQKWQLVKNKPNNDGYFLIEIAKQGYYVHRIIASCFLGLNIKNSDEHIDHYDGVRTNNCVENLRVGTQQENNWNNHAAKGCSWDKKRNKWHAYITLNNKQIYLGYFETEEEAHQAYLDAKLIYHVIPERPINFPPVQSLD